MDGTRLKVRVPGKLMVAGEYAVLEANQEAIVVAVDRYITAAIALSDENRLFLPGLGLTNIKWSWNNQTIQFSRQDVRLRYIERALYFVLEYLKSEQRDMKSFSLTIDSELDDPNGRKYGLGSSAAVVVAIVSSVLGLFGSGEPDLELIFRLSAMAHFDAQGSGSGADVAASTFGGWLRYRSFDSEWLSLRLQARVQPPVLVHETWPNFRAEQLIPPQMLYLCVGWTGEPAATAPLVQKVREMKNRDMAEYGRFLKDSSSAVSHLVQAFETHNMELVIQAFEQNRLALAKLGERAGVPIETPLLLKLHELAKAFGGAGKPSGAGGGDCGIALMVGESSIQQLFQAWRNSGIEPLAIHVSQSGVQMKIEFQ